MNSNQFLSIVLFFCILLGYQKETFELQAGDLLFQQWDQSDFAKAINAVTEGYKGNDFAHVGLVLSYNGTLKVLEATNGKGVCLTPVDSFLQASKNQAGAPRIAVGRLKQEYQSYVSNISDWSLAHVGKSYDTLFVYGNDQYYCAELLHDAFNLNIPGGQVFDLAPMTFKDPITNHFFPVWETYFRNVEAIIPEGAPGLNPGSMSRSDKLEIVWEYFK